MTLWLLLSILAPLLWGSATILDSIIRRHFIQSDGMMTWITAISRLPVAIGLVAFLGFQKVDLGAALGMLFAGILWTTPFLLYFHALKLEEVSRIALFLQMISVFTLLFAFILLNEKLSWSEGIGFICMLMGGLLASIKKNHHHWSFSKAFIWMIGAAAGWGLSDVLFKKFEPALPGFGESIALYLIGSVIPAFLFFIFKQKRQMLQSYIEQLSTKAWLLMLSSNAMGILGSIAFAYALTLGKASLTTVLAEIQPLYAFIVAILIYQFFPNSIEKEKSDVHSLAMKGLSFLFIVIGVLWIM